ncbi:MAG: hypothetical protein Kow00103_05060 [Candidatus Caldatribacteriota bacterium]
MLACNRFYSYLSGKSADNIIVAINVEEKQLDLGIPLSNKISNHKVCFYIFSEKF